MGNVLSNSIKILQGRLLFLTRCLGLFRPYASAICLCVQGVGLSRRAARTIGVAVDHRRRNRSAESLTLNTERLKTYLSKLVMFPRKSKAKKGHGGIPADTPRKDISNVTQLPILQAMPIERPSMKIPARAITEEERKFRAYGALRRARRDAHNVGKRKTEEAAA
eukprot:GHVT01100537.1.p1 GENE.GHVT01100537.1~~GHVT01100537.1.p1  ORF type:complete len:165 (+),score=7.14 GHVT01100537.1:618-1112(+)